ncbi:MAG: MFS transporter [Spirochaetales bacterium]|nr:MFS transporter [Spirochaetales bacterium]
MSSPFLSAEEKIKGIKHHYRFQFFNGLGFNFLGDTPVILLAVYFGATNTQLGYLSSVIYFAGVFLSMVPRIFAGKNIVSLQYLSWLIRGIICLAYIALFFIQGRYAVWLILVVYTMFCTARIVGAAIYQPLIRMISSSRTRGTILSASSLRFQLSNTLSRGISFLVTSLKQLTGITGLLFLEIAGVVLNTVAAFEIRKIPCREKIKYTKGRNVFIVLRDSLREREIRLRIFLAWLNTAQLVLFSFIIPLLSRDAGFSTSMIFLLTLAAGISTIASAFFARSFGDRLGSRPLLIWVISLLAVNSIIWVLVSSGTAVFIYFIFMFITTFFLRANDLLVNRLIVESLPEGDTVGFSSMINFSIAFVALLFGYAGGRLADLSSARPFFFVSNGYSYTFLLAFILCFISLILTLKIREKGSLSPGEAAAIIFSPTNLTTYQKIGRLYTTENRMDRQTILLNIGKNNSRMATEEIRSILFNPLLTDKGQLITSLFSNPRPALLPDLLREASDAGSYHRLKAIFALGAYPGDKTEKLLISILDGDDPAAASNAAKSLGRIGCVYPLQKVAQQASRAAGIWNRMNYIIALKHMDKAGSYLSGLFSVEKAGEGSAVSQTVYSLHASLLEMDPPLADIFQIRNMKRGSGLSDFLDEARGEELFYESHHDFQVWFRDDELARIWERCKEIISGREVPSYFQEMKNSLLSYPAERSGYDDALAAVYFTFQLLKVSG